MKTSEAIEILRKDPPQAKDFIWDLYGSPEYDKALNAYKEAIVHAVSVMQGFVAAQPNPSTNELFPEYLIVYRTADYYLHAVDPILDEHYDSSSDVLYKRVEKD